jgi:hypothetical protein
MEIKVNGFAVVVLVVQLLAMLDKRIIDKRCCLLFTLMIGV